MRELCRPGIGAATLSLSDVNAFDAYFGGAVRNAAITNALGRHGVHFLTAYLAGV